MKKTNIIVAAAMAASFGLVGCGGGGGGSAAASTTTVSGTAVDPELVGATVCFDMNKNNECEVNEPSVKTDMKGHYSITLDTSDIQAGVTLLVQGGYDRVTKMPFVGTMRTMIDESNTDVQQMITPLTTLVYERAIAVPETMAQAQQEVADLLGMEFEDVQKNMLTVSNEVALQSALAIQQAAELAAEANNTRAFYKAMATNMAAYSNDFNGLIKHVAGLNPSDMKKNQVIYFNQAMNAMNAIFTDSAELYAMSTEKMQEMIEVMSSSDLNNFTNISGKLQEFIISTTEMESFITEHMLIAAGVSQGIIDQVLQAIVNNADITVDTSFEMMITVIDQLKADGDISQVQYDAMVTQLQAMKAEFEPAS